MDQGSPLDILLFALWVVTGVEIICVYLIGLSRLQRIALRVGYASIAYREWRLERKAFEESHGRWEEDKRLHFERLAQECTPDAASELRRLSKAIDDELSRATELDRINAQSMGSPGDEVQNPHLNSMSALENQRLDLAIKLGGGPVPPAPRSPSLSLAAKAELIAVSVMWAVGLWWLWTSFGPQAMSTLHSASDALASEPVLKQIGYVLVGVICLLIAVPITGVLTIAIAMLLRAIAGQTLIALSTVAGWSLRRATLRSLFMVGFIVSFIVETVRRAPIAWDGVKDLLQTLLTIFT